MLNITVLVFTFRMAQAEVKFLSLTTYNAGGFF